jgi:DNA invertase Pin-like site-specific DNA recombinase
MRGAALSITTRKHPLDARILAVLDSDTPLVQSLDRVFNKLYNLAGRVEISTGSREIMAKLVAYYRVSTKRQGDSGLGLEGQKAAVLTHAATSSTIIAEYVEVESGRKSNRPELAKALAHAKLAGATLCIAKLDRLARNVAFLSGLMEAKRPFVCCDNPHATPLTIHILAAVAEAEAVQISARTKSALAAYKAGNRVSKRIREKYPEGVPAKVVKETAGKLGGALPQCRNLTDDARRKGHERGVKAASDRAADLASKVGPIVQELRQGGATLQAIAKELNDRHYVTRRGKPWSHVAVLRLLSR